MQKQNPRPKGRPKAEAKAKEAPILSKKVDEALSEVDKCFIENNDIPVEELAKKLGKPVSVVKAYCVWYEKVHPPKKPIPKALALMDRPAKGGGVICMTQTASMEGNQDNRKSVTLEAIHRAMSEMRFDDAKALKERYDQQEKEQKKAIRDVHSGHIFYINDPGDDPNRAAY